MWWIDEKRLNIVLIVSVGGAAILRYVVLIHIKSCPWKKLIIILEIPQHRFAGIELSIDTS